MSGQKRMRHRTCAVNEIIVIRHSERKRRIPRIEKRKQEYVSLKV